MISEHCLSLISICVRQWPRQTADMEAAAAWSLRMEDRVHHILANCMDGPLCNANKGATAWFPPWWSSGKFVLSVPQPVCPVVPYLRRPCMSFALRGGSSLRCIYCAAAVLFLYILLTVEKRLDFSAENLIIVCKFELSWFMNRMICVKNMHTKEAPYSFLVVFSESHWFVLITA